MKNCPSCKSNNVNESSGKTKYSIIWECSNCGCKWLVNNTMQNKKKYKKGE